MKRTLCSGLAITIAITCTIFSANAKKRQIAWLKVTGNPTCIAGATLPSNCSATGTGFICTVGSSTYYQDGNCSAPFFKNS